MSDELKACPFCGVESKLVVGRIYSNHSSLCILNANLVYDFQKPSWNSRPIESALEAKLAIAVEALEKLQLGFEDDDGIAIKALAEIRNYTGRSGAET